MRYCDRVIALKFPAYLVPHRQKVLWILHQYRQAYDLWDAGKSNIPDTPRARLSGQNRLQLPTDAVARTNVVADVRPVEPGDDQPVTGDAELGEDVRLGSPVGGRG